MQAVFLQLLTFLQISLKAPSGPCNVKLQMVQKFVLLISFWEQMAGRKYDEARILERTCWLAGKQLEENWYNHRGDGLDLQCWWCIWYVSFLQVLNLFSLTNPDADLQMSPVCWGSKRYLVHLPSGSAIKYIVYKENMFEWSVSVFMVYDITFQYLRILLIWWWLFRMQENRLLVSVGATAKRYPHRNCTSFQKWPLDTRYHGTLERSRVKETWKCYLSPSGECRPLASHRQSQRLDCHHGSYSSQAFKVANSFSLPRLISSPPLHPRGLPLVISLFWALKCSNWLCMTLSFQFSVLSRQGLSCMQ